MKDSRDEAHSTLKFKNVSATAHENVKNSLEPIPSISGYHEDFVVRSLG